MSVYLSHNTNINFQGGLNKTLYDAAKHCAYCGEEFSYEEPKTAEHIIPLNRGSKEEKRIKKIKFNKLPVCKPCNQERGCMPLEDWFQKHPEAEENTKKCLKELSNLEIDGVNYSEAIAETISKALHKNFTFTGGQRLNICA